MIRSISEKISGERIAVLGLGRSGCAACNFLLKSGARVVAHDDASLSRKKKEIRGLVSKAKLTFGKPIKLPRDIRMLVVSPGIPENHQWIDDAQCLSVPVISELELGIRYISNATIIAVTGTNGKSTTTALIGHILNVARSRGRFAEVLVGGNFGTPITELVSKHNHGVVYVLEVSSYQLLHTQTFKPKVAVLLNVTPDHLERHCSFENYTSTKAKLFKKQTAGDFAILNGDDPLCLRIADEIPATRYFFSTKKHVKRGAFLAGNGQIRSTIHECMLHQKDIKIPGEHNLMNVLASVLVAQVLGIEGRDIVDGVRSFKGLPHRLEVVRRLGGRTFINDSKATNVESVAAALSTGDDNLLLIMGGRGKGQSYRPLASELKKKVRFVVTIGEDAIKIARDIGDSCTVIEAVTLPRAVRLAWELSKPGDTIMLSPGAASFDQFSNYEERGEEFRKWVRKLK